MKKIADYIMYGVFAALIVLALTSCYAGGGYGMSADSGGDNEAEEDISWQEGEENIPDEENTPDDESIPDEVTVPDEVTIPDEVGATLPECEEPTAEVEEGMAIDDVIVHQDEDEVIIGVKFEESPMDCYHFTVSRNGILEASLGLSLEYLYYDLVDVLETVNDHATVQLTKSELDYLIGMADEIEERTEEDDWDRLGRTWVLLINYNGKFYAFNHWADRPIVYKNFIDQLIVLSPIRKPEFWERYTGVLADKGQTPGRRTE